MFGVELPPDSKTLYVHTQTLGHTAEQLQGAGRQSFKCHSPNNCWCFRASKYTRVLPLSSWRQDSSTWLWTGRTAGTGVAWFLVWLRTQGLWVEGTDASAAPADWTQTDKIGLLVFGRWSFKGSRQISQPPSFYIDWEADSIHLDVRAFLGMKAKSSKGKNSLGPMMPNPIVRFAWSLEEEGQQRIWDSRSGFQFRLNLVK